MSILWGALFVILSVTLALIIVSSDIYSKNKEDIDSILSDSEKYDPNDDTVGPLEQSRLKLCYDNRIFLKLFVLWQL